MSSLTARATLRVAELSALTRERGMRRLCVLVTDLSLMLFGLCTARPGGATWTDATVRVYDSGAQSDGNRREALAKEAAACARHPYVQATSPSDSFAETLRLETAEG